MELSKDSITMLDRIGTPAFFVRDGSVTYANEAASQLPLTPGTPITPLLATGVLEYSAFTEGCLYLTLDLSGSSFSASVTRLEEGDLFVLEQPEDQTELQSMALAAQHLRTPLSNIMTVADRLFPTELLSADPAAQDQVARINRGLFQLLRIVSNMSDAYRYTQEQSGNPETREVGSFLGSLLADMAPFVEATGLEFSFEGLGESIYCLIDPERLERAVSNILSNAMKFNIPGGSVRSKLTRVGKMLHLTVSNTGTPTRGDTDPYSQYRRMPGLQDSRYGIGLGMVLIRKAAAAHGGTVLIRKDPDGTTSLTMTLAIRQDSVPALRCGILRPDYAGERDHRLLELSESLPADFYRRENIN